VAHVLLIEDDPTQRAVAALVLTAGGHQVQEAPAAERGLQLARERRPDLVVCDVVMPGMNGYQFVAAVRKDPALCALPIVLLTSLAERAQVRVGMTTGADDYLAKPVEPDELLQSVSALLERRTAQVEAIASTYETQLLRELDARWKQDLEAGRELRLPHATVLLADLFDVVAREGRSHPEPAELLKRAHQAACDALYLFGASHVLPHGGDLLAVFAAAPGAPVPLAGCVKAAFALQAAVAGVLGGRAAGAVPLLTAAFDAGAFSLVRLQDPLHGDSGIAPVPGPTLHRVQALRRLARERGWALTTSTGNAVRLPPGVAATGRCERDEGSGIEAQELRSARPEPSRAAGVTPVGLPSPWRG